MKKVVLSLWVLFFFFFFVFWALIADFGFFFGVFVVSRESVTVRGGSCTSL